MCHSHFNTKICDYCLIRSPRILGIKTKCTLQLSNESKATSCETETLLAYLETFGRWVPLVSEHVYSGIVTKVPMPSLPFVKQPNAVN